MVRVADTAAVTQAKRRTFSSVAVAILAVAGLMFSDQGSSAAAGWRYTVVAFSNTSDTYMDVYQSADGSAFEPVAKPAYRPPSGRVRDPSIFRHTDGFYYVTYTTVDGANIGFARSRDRVHWSFVRNVPVPLCCAFLPGTGDGKGLGSSSGPGSSGSAGSSDGPSLSPFTTKAWAPDWFVEGGRVNVIFSMSTGGGFVPYIMTALDSSLRAWGPPIPLAGLGADHIDTTVVKVGSTYHAFTKNETKKVVQHAVSSSLYGPYRFIAPGNWGAFVEGPAVIQLPGGAWRIYLDAYKAGKYLYSDSTDGLNTWTPVKELPALTQTLLDLLTELSGSAVRAWGIRVNGRLVASMRIRVDRDVAEVMRLVVAPDMQGRGMGTRLLAAVDSVIPENVTRVELFTGERSVANIRLYQRMGYREIRRRDTGPYDLVYLARYRD
ncbi:hypothetical protein GOSPT_113_00270 [Gordonia sputi NBRC 100414]|uniref:N-acetyltransferase domain-containing protein n=1 Tax=Gordonia sputi NBRC 100414 TaxID=1089453 RepID=H5U4I0_9ACTN|nr:hypothetical protein GOSPT_113_00270 [Gordonia sputi NBRC 100414]